MPLSSIAAAIALAALCLVLFPSAAFAAAAYSGAVEGGASVLVVTCAEDEPAALPLETICEVLPRVRGGEDDEGFFAAAPICDPSGASAVAPQPVSPIGDDKLEQTPGCDEIAAALQLGPRPPRDDSSHHQISSSAEPALVPDALPAPCWSGEVTVLPPVALLGPADGVRQAIEHPPHAA